MTTEIQKILETAIPYARSIPVRLIAENLAPNRKVYVFIEDIMCNSFIINAVNSINSFTKINIINSGSGYSQSNTIIKFNGQNTSPAVAIANVFGGEIVGVDFVKYGRGYDSNASISVLGSGSGANLAPVLIYSTGADLYTDNAGKVEFWMYIPNTLELKFKTGVLNFAVSDNPIFPLKSKSYATCSFISNGVKQFLPRAKLTPPTTQTTNGNGLGNQSQTNNPTTNINNPPAVIDNTPKTPTTPQRPKPSTGTHTNGNITYVVTPSQTKFSDFSVSGVIGDKSAMDSVNGLTIKSKSIDKDSGVLSFTTSVESNGMRSASTSNADNVVDGRWRTTYTVNAPNNGKFDKESMDSLVVTAKNGKPVSQTITLSPDGKQAFISVTTKETKNKKVTTELNISLNTKQDLTSVDWFSGSKITTVTDGNGNIISQTETSQTLPGNADSATALQNAINNSYVDSLLSRTDGQGNFVSRDPTTPSRMSYGVQTDQTTATILKNATKKQIKNSLNKAKTTENAVASLGDTTILNGYNAAIEGMFNAKTVAEVKRYSQQARDIIKTGKSINPKLVKKAIASQKKLQSSAQAAVVTSNKAVKKSK